MTIEQVEVPDGYSLFPYFVKTEDVDLAIQCFASRVRVRYARGEDGSFKLDENGNRIEMFTPAERARERIAKILNRDLVRYQKEKVKIAALRAAKIKDDVIS
jgi:hypothetical protein